LRTFVRAVVATVTAKPPFVTFGSPQVVAARPSRTLLAALQREAERLVANANASIDRACARKTEREEREAYRRAGDEIGGRFASEIGRLKQMLDPGREADVALDGAVESDIEVRARVQAYREAQAELAGAYGRRQLSFEQYMKAIREMARIHFQNTLAEILQK
jgi:hypothetical protein